MYPGQPSAPPLYSDHQGVVPPTGIYQQQQQGPPGWPGTGTSYTFGGTGFNHSPYPSSGSTVPAAPYPTAATMASPYPTATLMASSPYPTATMAQPYPAVTMMGSTFPTASMASPAYPTASMASPAYPTASMMGGGSTTYPPTYNMSGPPPPYPSGGLPPYNSSYQSTPSAGFTQPQPPAYPPWH